MNHDMEENENDWEAILVPQKKHIVDPKKSNMWPPSNNNLKTLTISAQRIRVSVISRYDNADADDHDRCLSNSSDVFLIKLSDRAQANASVCTR